MVIGHDLELIVAEQRVRFLLSLHGLGRRVELRVDQLLAVAVLHPHDLVPDVGLHPHLELALAQNGRVARGDGALGVLVGVLAGELGQDHLLDLVLHHVLVLAQSHP